MLQNHHVFLKERPGVSGQPTEAHFGYGECPAPSDDLEEGDVVIKNMFLSVDPAQRCQMNEDTGAHYLQPWQIGETINGLHGVGSVVNSKNSAFQSGDLVHGKMMWSWSRYFVLRDKSVQRYLTKLDKNMLQDQPYLPLSLLGVVGLTSLIGIREKANIKPGSNQTCVVSGAAGACGSLAGQIAKLEGCSRVVGICGSEEKCNWLTTELGFEAAINYKTAGVDEKLKQACPNGIDVYFDNVGGPISDSVLKQMNKDSHVVLCGAISKYNETQEYPPPISDEIKRLIEEKNITRDRFLVLSHTDQFDAGIQQLAKWYFQGELKVRETITEGLENTGAAFVSMMNGGNIGKQLVHVADL